MNHILMQKRELMLPAYYNSIAMQVCFRPHKRNLFSDRSEYYQLIDSKR